MYPSCNTNSDNFTCSVPVAGFSNVYFTHVLPSRRSERITSNGLSRTAMDVLKTFTSSGFDPWATITPVS